MVNVFKIKKIKLFSALNCYGLIRKLTTGEYCLYYRRKAGKKIIRKRIGTYSSLAVAKKYELEN